MSPVCVQEEVQRSSRAHSQHRALFEGPPCVPLAARLLCFTDEYAMLWAFKETEAETAGLGAMLVGRAGHVRAPASGQPAHEHPWPLA